MNKDERFYQLFAVTLAANVSYQDHSEEGDTSVEMIKVCILTKFLVYCVSVYEFIQRH